ncbi:MAG: DUF4296 domain-containing protein [Flavobacteriales bacterium]|nr:DUF4296 domain-containing protein [Flavobacteriales bacterium]
MKKFFSYILILFILGSCSSELEKPQPFFEHDEMVALMTDLSLAEGTRMYARPDHKANIDNDDPSISEYYALVLTKYDITQAELDSINAWYIHYPEEYQSIFKAVLDSLNKMQAEEKALRIKKSKKLIIPRMSKTDSIRLEEVKLDSLRLERDTLRLEISIIDSLILMDVDDDTLKSKNAKIDSLNLKRDTVKNKLFKIDSLLLKHGSIDSLTLGIALDSILDTTIKADSSKTKPALRVLR